MEHGRVAGVGVGEEGVDVAVDADADADADAEADADPEAEDVLGGVLPPALALPLVAALFPRTFAAGSFT